MPTGIVKWFSAERGFGFITGDHDAEDVFTHYTSIEAHGYRSLEQGQRVEFEVVQGPKGRQAAGVRVLETESAAALPPS